MEMNPIVRFREVYSRAEKSPIELPDAASLATVTEEGQPTVRVVLVKAFDERGFVFYTNLESAKGHEMANNSRASLCFWWEPLQEQVRIEGAVEQLTDAEADDYFATRDRNSQLGAWASQQSREMSSLDDLVKAFEEVTARFGNGDVPRPPYWGGYRLQPERIEFWVGKPYRLHERYLYTRRGGDWVVTLLYP